MIILYLFEYHPLGNRAIFNPCSSLKRGYKVSPDQMLDIRLTALNPGAPHEGFDLTASSQSNEILKRCCD